MQQANSGVWLGPLRGRVRVVMLGSIALTVALVAWLVVAGVDTGRDEGAFLQFKLLVGATPVLVTLIVMGIATLSTGMFLSDTRGAIEAAPSGFFDIVSLVLGRIAMMAVAGIVCGMFFLLAIGMPLGFASAFLAVAVLVMKFGPELLFGHFGRGPLALLSQAFYRQMSNYVLISVPLFIFMAALLERSGIAKDMYSSLNIWMSRTRGGIAIVTSIMAVIIAVMSGIIGGEVVLLGLIALPQMLRLGYNQNLAIGTICASGSLGTMIPPSIVLIFHGLITETSIKALFFTATGWNKVVEGADPIRLGMVSDLPGLAAVVVISLALIMPVFLPIVLLLPDEELGFIGHIDPKNVAIWFGVVFTMNMQVSFLSPPFGPAAFYLKSVAPPHISLTDIFKGFLPFIGIQLLALLVLLMWPNPVSVFL